MPMTAAQVKAEAGVIADAIAASDDEQYAQNRWILAVLVLLLMKLGTPAP